MSNFSERPKGISRVAIIVTVLVVAFVAVGGVYLYSKDRSNTNTVSNENGNVTVNKNTTAVSANENGNTNSSLNKNINSIANSNLSIGNNTNTLELQTYTDTEFGFSFTYPADWRLSVSPNGTISVAPQNFQEPVQLMKALAANTEEIISWIEDNWLDPDSDKLEKTTSTYSFENFSADIYEIKGRKYVAIANLIGFSLAARIERTQNIPLYTEYYSIYQDILNSLRSNNINN